MADENKLNNDFVHLRAISSNSMITSLMSLDDIINKSYSEGMKSVAITDINRMFGTIKHVKKAKEKGMKPIVGVEVEIKPTQTENNDELFRNGTHKVILLCRSEASYKMLMKLVSASWMKNQENGTPYILEEDILELRQLHNKSEYEDLGFTVLLGGQDTWLGQQLSNEDPNPSFKNSVSYIQWMKSLFGNNDDALFLELQRKASTEKEAESEFNWISRSMLLSQRTKD